MKPVRNILSIKLCGFAPFFVLSKNVHDMTCRVIKNYPKGDPSHRREVVVVGVKGVWIVLPHVSRAHRSRSCRPSAEKAGEVHRRSGVCVHAYTRAMEPLCARSALDQGVAGRIGNAADTADLRVLG